VSELERYNGGEVSRSAARRMRPVQQSEQAEAYKAHCRIQYGYGLARTAAVEATALDADIKNLTRDNPALELRCQGFADTAELAAKITIMRYVNRP
jgi:hypothetical protein